MPENKPEMSLATINFKLRMAENSYLEAMGRRGKTHFNQEENELLLHNLHQELVELYKLKKKKEGTPKNDDDELILERDFFEEMLRRKREDYLAQQALARQQRQERGLDRDFDMER